MTQHRGSTRARAGRVLAILMTGSAAVVSGLLALVVLSSRLGDADSDPHGYTLIFGSLLLVPTSVVGAMALPFVPGRAHPRARRLAAWGALAWVAGAVALAWFALSG